MAYQVSNAPAEALPWRGTAATTEAPAACGQTTATRQPVFMFETSIAQTWTDGLVDVEFTAECPSGAATDQRTVQAHR
jgi:hypothetical protein